MLFNSIQYAVFLPIVVVLFWGVPARWRVDLLLVASYVFYASWSPGYAAMLFGLAIANYLFGLWVGRAQSHRKLVLWTCIGADLAVLGFFKYWNFASDSATRLADDLVGQGWDPILVNVILPLGISFFTFEFIHYLVDIYRGDMPVHSFSKFHVFAAFFPTQISGPIKRFQQFVPALTKLAEPDYELMRDGLRLIGVGLVKKVLIADKLAPVANAGFAAAEVSNRIGTGEAWIATLAFALQIYLDFSGYTDIARGSAQLLGFHIPLNFDDPYLATSVSNFWHRWHISLSTWLRDYVYIPLGGSRRGLAVVLRNLLITFLLGGLWHGAAWHFVAWGAYWGIVLCLDRLIAPFLPRAGAWYVKLSGWAVTQLVVLVGWVLFRASSLTSALEVVKAMFVYRLGSETYAPTIASNVVGVAVVLVAGSWLLRARPWPALPRPIGAIAAGLGTAAACALILTAGAPLDQRFIYFQF